MSFGWEWKKADNVLNCHRLLTRNQSPDVCLLKMVNFVANVSTWRDNSILVFSNLYVNNTFALAILLLMCLVSVESELKISRKTTSTPFVNL